MTRRRRRDRTGPASPPDGPFQLPEADPEPTSSEDAEVAEDRPDAAMKTTVMPAVPTDQPSAQVLSELRAFFTGHGDGTGARAAEQAVAAGDAGGADAEVGKGAGDAAAAPSAPAELELQPAPTKRAVRRSRREAKREARLEAKRLKAHAEQAEREADDAAAPALPDDTGTVGDPGESVRIVADDVEAAGDDGAAGDDRAAGDDPAAGDAAAVVSIVDDGELPDAVYLDGGPGTGSADPSTGSPDESEAAEPAKVFIDDQDPATGAVVTVEAAAAQPRIEPRLRDRRMAVQRTLTRKRLKVLAAVAAAVVVVVGGLGVLGSGAFAVSNIVVEGASYSTGDQLDEIIAEIGGTNVMRLDTGEIEARLERIAWVSSARVSTNLPNSVTIEIAERRPVSAYRASDGRWRVLDVDGRVLDVLEGQPVGFVPIEPFDTSPNLSPGANAPRGFRGAATLARMLGGALAEQVAQIGVDADGTDLRMYLVGGVEVRFGAASDLIDKLVRLDLALTDPDHIPTELIDVSTQDYVVR